MPLVTFLMPVHNGADTIAESVRSVFAQPGENYELLLVDDGSSDGSADIARAVAAEAGRTQDLRVLTSPQNQGLVAALNRGLAACDSRYVARIDADDLCRPQRLALQAAFLEDHPDVGLLGSAYARFGAERDIQHPPDSDEAIRAHMALDNPFGHSTIMVRREVLERAGPGYDPRYRHVEDYALWTRLLASTQGANLPDVVVDYRVHAGAISTRHADEQASGATLVALRYLASLGVSVRQMDVEVHHHARLMVLPADRLALLALHGWLSRVRAGLLNGGGLSAAAVDAVIATRYRMLSTEALRRGRITPGDLDGLETLEGADGRP